MASNNNELVFYQQWAVAGLQNDKYSTNPWCVDSKNLDIFSDNQSIKGTAWSEPTQIEPVEWIDEDERGRFRLYADGTVYDSVEDVTYNHTYYDAHAETINWKDWQWAIVHPFWTPRKLFVKYDEQGSWSVIVVITDTLKWYIPRQWISIDMTKLYTGNAQFWDTDTTYYYHRIKYTSSSNRWWANVTTTYRTARTIFNLEWSYWNFTDGKIEIAESSDLTYDPETKIIKSRPARAMREIGKFTQNDWNITLTEWSQQPIWTSTQAAWSAYINCEAYISWNISTTDTSWWSGIRIEAKSDDWNSYLYIQDAQVKDNWVYLKPLENRQVIQIDDKWYMQVDTNEYEEIEWYKNYDNNGSEYWTLMTAGSFALPDWQDIAAIAKSFDYRLVFVNKVDYDIWMIYYVPAGDDILTFSQGWEYPWLKFINATMINWYAYIIAENRWIRGLYIFYNWQIKKIASSDIRYTEAMSLMDWKQIYDFTWPMFNWRGKVVAPTKTGIYMYWENKWGQNVGSFILKLAEWTVNKVDVVNGKLRVEYSIGDNNYYKEYQDDINIKTYESEFSITYPVQISSHILEKEPLKLAVSYDIPNSSTSMDVYLSVNDYHFWSFLTDWTVEPEVWDKFKVSWLSWNYWLIFVEKDWNWLTFTLDGDLPYQSANTMNLVSEDNSTTIGFSDINHFKKIWTISKASPQEKIGKHTLLNISNGNDLPIVRKAQVKIVWKTDTHVSPLLYDVRFLSTQLDK